MFNFLQPHAGCMLMKKIVNNKVSNKSVIFSRPLPTDTALRGYVITSVLAPSQLDCGYACLKNDQCKSFNFQQRLSTNEVGPQLCELNNATRLTHPQDLGLREGVFYYDNLLPPVSEIDFSKRICTLKFKVQNKVIILYH